MIIGVLKEIKVHENRVSLTPAGVVELSKRKHKVYIESAAGLGSGYTDEQYKKAGAGILKTAREVYEKSEMIIKVKEPLEKEYRYIRKDQVVFTYFHFASSEKLTSAMIKSKSVCIAYETVEKADRSLPLLIPMSEVAGRMSIQQGAFYLEKHNKGRGVLLGGVPGVKPANVLILGAGIVGTQAARMAAGLGANVTIMDVNLQRLRYLNEIMPPNVNTVMSNEFNIRETVKVSDLIIGAVLIPGAKAPVLISKDMLKLMNPGTVLIDVAVDQGGCIETCKPTTHENPTYIIDEVVHYCVANMPGAVPFTSTLALTNASLPYIVQLADKGWRKACKENIELKAGLNIIEGNIVYKKIAECYNRPYIEADNFLK
ncbi:MAG TPA: alanine dehydrogenase [Cytophagaceae bacterium]|nr:alanine dehydrogenase [Cytophagaceae bacterium]